MKTDKMFILDQLDDEFKRVMKEFEILHEVRKYFTLFLHF